MKAFKKAFTLIELIVVIWIIWIFMATYLVSSDYKPLKQLENYYNYYKCDFIYKIDDEKFKCYIDRNKNWKLDPSEKDYWWLYDWNKKVQEKLTNWKYYYFYNKTYLIEIDNNWNFVKTSFIF